MGETCRSTVLSAVLAVVLGAGAAATAQEASGGGPKEGITVHGEWTIVVRNRDGSLARRYEFLNGLQDPLFLVSILGRQVSHGAWGVRVGPDGSGFCGSPTHPEECEVTERFNPDAGLAPLTIDIPGTGPQQGRFVLKGTLRASVAGSIASVATTAGYCPPAILPGLGCRAVAPNGVEFRRDVTGTAIPRIEVQAGQTVDVQVVISFS